VVGGNMGACFMNLLQDGMGATGLSDRGRLAGQRERFVTAALCGGDVDQPNQVCGNARHEADLTAKPQ
jgi:hypothetical protein